MEAHLEDRVTEERVSVLLVQRHGRVAEGGQGGEELGVHGGVKVDLCGAG